MKNTKGFTLIELLAVIVILAIIAVIATPIILNIIEDARVSAAEDSAYNVVSAVQTYYATSQLDATPATLPLEVTWTAGTPDVSVVISGTTPTSGSVELLANGTVDVDTLVIGDYTCNGDATSITCAAS